MLRNLIHRIMSRISVEGYQDATGFNHGKFPDNPSDRARVSAHPLRCEVGGTRSLGVPDRTFSTPFHASETN